ncbi:MAG: beta-ketoacyl synthase chain length factor [Pseudomonadota bacterium]
MSRAAMSLSAYIRRAAFAAPGLPSLNDLEAKWDAPWGPEAWEPMPSGLRPRQAMRLSPATRAAMLVAESLAPVDPQTAWVFASSVGEGQTLDIILRALCAPDMMIQPLKFQNAVHNAASGQWSIAGGITGPVTSVAAYDETVGAGLLKCLLQMRAEGRPVALVAYDAPIPVPLDEKRPLGVPMGVGLLLSDRSAEALARIEVRLVSPAPAPCPSPPTSPAGRALTATGNPIAAILPLLECLSSGGLGMVRLGLSGGGCLEIAVAPV